MQTGVMRAHTNACAMTKSMGVGSAKEGVGFIPISSLSTLGGLVVPAGMVRNKLGLSSRLPRGLSNAWDQTVGGHFTESDTGQFESAKKSATTT